MYISGELKAALSCLFFMSSVNNRLKNFKTTDLCVARLLKKISSIKNLLKLYLNISYFTHSTDKNEPSG